MPFGTGMQQMACLVRAQICLSVHIGPELLQGSLVIARSTARCAPATSSEAVRMDI
jgi:hypothetical protein